MGFSLNLFSQNFSTSYGLFKHFLKQELLCIFPIWQKNALLWFWSYFHIFFSLAFYLINILSLWS